MFNKFIRQHYILSSVALIVFIVLFGTVLFLMNGNNTVQQQAPVVTNTVTNAPEKSNVAMPQKSGNTFVSDNYQVVVPNTWTQDTSPMETTQGSLLYLHPSNSANVAVEVNHAEDTSLAGMSSGLAVLGLKKVNTTVDGVAAQKFSGTVTLSNKVLHNTIYLFSYNDYVYMIKLSYTGNLYNTQVEQEFTQFVNSFIPK